MNDDDWYEKGVERIIESTADVIVNIGGVDDLAGEDAAIAVYDMLRDYGFIDYDVEKEIFYRWEHGEEE
jgi:hypothetical protein